MYNYVHHTNFVYVIILHFTSTDRTYMEMYICTLFFGILSCVAALCTHNLHETKVH